MRKLSIIDLENARVNPFKYGKSMVEGTMTNGIFSGRPKSMKWHDAVLEYYETGSLSRAISKLEKSFSNRKNTKKNQKEVEDLIIALDNYITEHDKIGLIHFDKRINIDKILTPQLKLSGWIWLMSMTSEGGYAGFIISKEVNEINWMLELRFPVLQAYIANQLYGCDVNKVNVGLIDYKTGNFFLTSYTEEDIIDATDELDRIGKTISNILLEGK